MVSIFKVCRIFWRLAKNCIFYAALNILFKKHCKIYILRNLSGLNEFINNFNEIIESVLCQYSLITTKVNIF